MRKWHTFGKNGEKWPKSRKNCQIGHQSGNFEAISLSGGRSKARMNQMRAYDRIGTFPETFGDWKMGVNGGKWSKSRKNGQNGHYPGNFEAIKPGMAQSLVPSRPVPSRPGTGRDGIFKCTWDFQKNFKKFSYIFQKKSSWVKLKAIFLARLIKSLTKHPNFSTFSRFCNLVWVMPATF